MNEQWTSLEYKGFPNYAVNDQGHILNLSTGRCLSVSRTKEGVAKVGLMHPLTGSQHTISVAPLVAHAFLASDNERFDTPICLNGDRMDNRVSNLALRPLWFAVKYHRQFHNNLRGFNEPVVEIRSGETFDTSWDAAVKYGLIDREILMAALNRTYVFPTHQEFRTIK